MITEKDIDYMFNVTFLFSFGFLFLFLKKNTFMRICMRFYVRLNDGPDFTIFILVGWGRSFLSAA